MSEKGYSFLQSHLVALIEIKCFADAFGQCCFQMERLWFSLFERKAGDARSWLDECLTKSLPLGGFERGCRNVTQAVEAGELESVRLTEVVELCQSVDACCAALAGRFRKSGGQHSDEAYYRLTLDGEKYALALSALILSVLKDMQNRHG